MTNLARELYTRTNTAVNFAINKSPYREDPNSGWYRLGFGEQMYPEMVDDHTIRYQRVSKPGTYIELRNLQLANLANIEWSQPVHIATDQKERRFIQLRVRAGDKTTVRQKVAFSKTTSLEEAANVAAKIAMEAQVGYTPGTATGGVGGHFKLGVELSASYSRKWGSVEQQSNEFEVNQEINGPIVGYLEISRSISRVQVSTETTPDFEHQIALVSNGVDVYTWNSWAELRNVLTGQAPLNVALAKEFVDDPVAPNAFKSIDRYKLPRINWTQTFDDVETYQVYTVADKEATEQLRLQGNQ